LPAIDFALHSNIRFGLKPEIGMKQQSSSITGSGQLLNLRLE
jgi:hypothetical protein